jgi:hypothetical protein
MTPDIRDTPLRSIGRRIVLLTSDPDHMQLILSTIPTRENYPAAGQRYFPRSITADSENTSSPSDTENIKNICVPFGNGLHSRSPRRMRHEPADACT